MTLLLLNLMTLACGLASARNDSTVFGRAAAARLDLAVPDAPAFSILGEEPTTIMRPSSLREVSILVSRFLEGGATVPQALALEVAPVSLVKGSDLPLREYQANPWLYRARISVASNSSGNGGRELSVGLRLSIIDRSDLRCDRILLDELYAVARVRTDVVAGAKLKFRGNPELFEELSDAEQRAVDGRMETYIDSAMGAISEDKIIEIRESARQRLWNAEILDVALAGKGTTPDTTMGGLRASSYGMWLTWGTPLGSPGLLLAGGNGRLETGADGKLDRYAGSVALRAYYGENEYKGYLETSGRWSGATSPEFGLDLGGELKLIAGLWLDATIGVLTTGDGDTVVKTAWNIRFATPEFEL